MGYIKWAFWLIVWALIAAFFHYTLPQNDVARVVDTFEQRIDFGENSLFWSGPNSGNADTATNRDVLFIQVVRNNDKPMVYRNEDTSAGWPPYFKFDTTNLQTEAADLKSTKDNPQWVMIKHYGWRNEFLSIFPNAVSIKAVDGPDVSKPIPFLNIAVLILFFAVVWAIWVRWRRFRQKRIDPVLEDMGDSIADAGDSLSRTRKRWFGR